MNLITKRLQQTFKQFPLHLQFMWVHSSLWVYHSFGPWKGNGVVGCNALTKVPPPYMTNMECNKQNFDKDLML